MKARRTAVGAWPAHLALVLLAPAPLLALAAATGTVDTSGLPGLLVGTATSAAAILLGARARLAGTSGWSAALLGVAAASELSPAGWSLAGRSTAPLDAGPSSQVVVAVVVLALAAITVVTVLRQDRLDLWVRAALATGVLCGAAWWLTGPVAIGLCVLGTALLAGASAWALHGAIEDAKREVEVLTQRLEGVEHGLRVDRARLHEINSTVAGIASAQELMDGGLSGDRGAALASMMRAEVERLQRLVADRAPRRQRSVDLDETVGQIVLSHLARGRVVLWQPTGLRALGRSDDIAEIVNVLLENAAVHGGPDAVTVEVTRDPDGSGVTITVADQGPGIDPALRDRAFDWGVSRPESPGQGIGLHVAAEISRRLGGRLELVPTSHGAEFALHLSGVPQEVSRDDDVVRAS